MASFKLQYRRVTLTLKQPFTIARGTKATVENVFVQLSDDSHTGYGEAAPNTRYNEDAAKVCRYMEAIPNHFFDEIQSARQLNAKLEGHNHSVTAVKAAQAALEMAWLDWYGKDQQQPLWQIWNAPQSTGPTTSYTIGLDEIGVMQEKVEAAKNYPVYKVKLGTDRDRSIIKALREVTDKPIRVDANEGWESLAEARDMITFLADQNIELIEKPMPAGNTADQKKLNQFSPLPLCADESFTGSESLEQIAALFDIINIKLMKTGSLVKSRQIIEEARKLNLQVMIGCMIESSIANTAGALLSLWADYADLDGHLLINDDPAAGLGLTTNKKIIMPDAPGLGVQMR